MEGHFSKPLILTMTNFTIIVVTHENYFCLHLMRNQKLSFSQVILLLANEEFKHHY